MIHYGANPPLTTHVEANNRFFLHLTVRRDCVTHHAPCWARQNGPGATELLHGRQPAVRLHEQDVHVLETRERNNTSGHGSPGGHVWLMLKMLTGGSANHPKRTSRPPWNPAVKPFRY